MVRKSLVSPLCFCGSSFLNHKGTGITKIHKEKSAIIGIVQYNNAARIGTLE